jgi:DNA-binding transcriptional MerR regulator
MAMNKRRLTTAEAAKAVGVAPGTLRALDRRGIFTPRRDWNRHRDYTEQDVDRLRELAGLDPTDRRG